MAFEDDQSTTFKLTLHPAGPTRLASFDAPPPWTDLADRAAELFRVRRAGLRASYVDADGDTITLDTEPELALFYANADPAAPGANVARFTILAEPADDEDKQDESETEGSGDEAGPFFPWPFPPHWGGRHPGRGRRGRRGGHGPGGHGGFPHMPFPPFPPFMHHHHHHHHPTPPTPPTPPHHHHPRGGHRHHGPAAAPPVPPSPPTAPVHPPPPGPFPPPFPGHAPQTPPAYGGAPHEHSGGDDDDDGACPCGNNSSSFPTMPHGFGFGRGGAGRRRNGSRHSHSHHHPFFSGGARDQTADPRSFFGGFGY